MLQMILWLLKKCNIPNVPSLWQFRSMQDKLRTAQHVKPEKIKSAQGNHFSVNDPRKSVAQVCSYTSLRAFTDYDYPYPAIIHP